MGGKARKSKKSKKKKKARPAKARVMARRRSGKVGREARRRPRAASRTQILIITRRRRKRRRRRELKAFRKVGPQSQVKLKKPIGGRDERGLPLSLPPLQDEQHHLCGQRLLQAGRDGAEIQRHHLGGSRDRHRMSQLRRES